MRRGGTKGDSGDRGFKPKPILNLISPESSHTWPCICPENYEPISRQSRGAGSAGCFNERAPSLPQGLSGCLCCLTSLGEGGVPSASCTCGTRGQGSSNGRMLAESHLAPWQLGQVENSLAAGRGAQVPAVRGRGQASVAQVGRWGEWAEPYLEGAPVSSSHRPLPCPLSKHQSPHLS